MKKLCEIYDISKEYDMSDNSVLVIVSELTEDILFTALPELKCYSDRIMQTEEWNEFLEINDSYRRNENKFYMREVRQSQKSEISNALYNQNDDMSSLLENDELKKQIDYALSFLKEQPKRRFLKHYSERFTYRQIADEENRNVRAVYDSIQTAKKKFIKYFSEYPQQNTLNKCK